MIIHVFFLGRYPNSLIYEYHTFVLSILIFSKWVYYKYKGWHYYMTDFCYTANTLLFIFLQFMPKNDYLFKACFFYANGALAVAIGAFRN